MGRPKARGKNIELLLQLQPGQRVWDLSLRQLRNLIKAAQRWGWKPRYRYNHETNTYVLWKA